MSETCIYINGLCRCCHARGNFKSLGVPYLLEDREEIYAVIIRETFDIIISPQPGESSASTYTICESCIVSLQDAARFKLQVLSCEEKLTKLLLEDDMKKELLKFEDHVKNDFLNCDEGNDLDLKYEIEDAKALDIAQDHIESKPKLLNTSHTAISCTKKREVKAKYKLRADSDRKRAYYASDIQSENTKEVNRHNLRQEQQKESSCHICNRKFTPKGLQIHMKKIHNIDKTYRCHICHNSFTKCSELTLHIKRTHSLGILYPCNVCNDVLNSAKLLRKHLDAHYNNEIVKCKECKKDFKRKSLVEHMRTHSQKFTCDFCNKSFISKQNLSYHIQTHTGEKPFICHVCAKSFKRTDHLKNHIFIMHSGQKPFQCKYCPKRFNIKWSRITHERQHTGKKPFSCDLCDKSFASKNHLKAHLAIHTGLKPYSCHTCGKQFSFAYTLKQHMTTHTGEKGFVCEICKKAFRQKVNLKSHMRMHTGEKAFSCDVCNDRLASKATLKSHMRRHTGEKYTCKICNKQISDIYQHMKRHSRGMN